MKISNLSLILVASYRATGVFSWFLRYQRFSTVPRSFLRSSHNRISFSHMVQRHFARKSSILDGITNSKGFGFFTRGNDDSIDEHSANDKGDESDPGEVKGTSLRVLKYPHPKLRQDNEIVTTFDDKLKQITEEMLLVMYAADGIGLAAPQVGINLRIMVFNEAGDAKRKDHEMVLINPIITAKSKKIVVEEEGCLSFPNIYGDVKRAQWIAVDYQTIDGTWVKNKYLEGINAIIFQHEYDHLDKILFIDHLSEKDRETNSQKLQRLIRKYGPGGAL